MKNVKTLGGNRQFWGGLGPDQEWKKYKLETYNTIRHQGHVQKIPESRIPVKLLFKKTRLITHCEIILKHFNKA